MANEISLSKDSESFIKPLAGFIIDDENGIFQVYLINPSKKKYSQVIKLTGGFSGDDDGLIETSKVFKELGPLPSESVLKIDESDLDELDFVIWYHLDLIDDNNEVIQFRFQLPKYYWWCEDKFEILPILNEKGMKFKPQERNGELIKERIKTLNMEPKYHPINKKDDELVKWVARSGNLTFMNKYKTILRYLSLIPVMFTIFVLVDWTVRLLFWFVRLPITIFEKLFGLDPGPIGKLMDGITDHLIGLKSIETLTIMITGIITGYAAVYVLSIIAPTNSKKTAKVLTIVYLALISLGLIASAINGITGENIMWSLLLSIGILLAWHTVKNESEQEVIKLENTVERSIITIFISTFLFMALLISLFFVV